MTAVVQYQIRLACLFQLDNQQYIELNRRVVAVVGVGIDTHQYSVAFNRHLLLEIDEIDFLR